MLSIINESANSFFNIALFTGVNLWSIEFIIMSHLIIYELNNSFVDEAQSLERNTLLTVLSRIGQNAKVVLTHDVAQRDGVRTFRFDRCFDRQ